MTDNSCTIPRTRQREAEAKAEAGSRLKLCKLPLPKEAASQGTLSAASSFTSDGETETAYTMLD